MYRATIFYVALAMTSPTLAAESPAQIFESPQVLSDSVSDISRMSIDELRAFNTFWAECDNVNGEAIIEHACDVSRQKYVVEYESGRALDRLIRAVEIVQKLIRAQDRTRDRVDPNMVSRFVNIGFALRDAANRRFATLRAGR